MVFDLIWVVVLGVFGGFLLVEEGKVSSVTPVISSGSSKLQVQHSEI